MPRMLNSGRGSEVPLRRVPGLFRIALRGPGCQLSLICGQQSTYPTDLSWVRFGMRVLGNLRAPIIHCYINRKRLSWISRIPNNPTLYPLTL